MFPERPVWESIGDRRNASVLRTRGSGASVQLRALRTGDNRSVQLGPGTNSHCYPKADRHSHHNADCEADHHADAKPTTRIYKADPYGNCEAHPHGVCEANPNAQPSASYPTNLTATAVRGVRLTWPGLLLPAA